MLGHRIRVYKSAETPTRSELLAWKIAAVAAPVPPAAKLFAEPRSAPVPMFSQEPLDQSDILAAQFPALYHHDACHGSHGTT